MVPLSIWTKITKKKKNHVTSLWRHISQSGQNWEKYEICFDHKILKASDLHWVCGKSFLGWIVKHEKKNKFGIKNKLQFLLWGLHQPDKYTLTQGTQGTPGTFAFPKMSGKDGGKWPAVISGNSRAYKSDGKIF